MDKATKKDMTDALVEMETEIQLLDSPVANNLMDVFNKLKRSIATVFFFSDDNEAVQIRTDLKCPYCGEAVYDNRAKKRDPNDTYYYRSRKADFKCSNFKEEACSGGMWKDNDLDSGVWYSASWWVNAPDKLPKEWNI